MDRFARILCSVANKRPIVIGMVHVRALPNTPNNRHNVQQLIDISCEETQLYKKYDLDGICVENMFDVPYVRPKDSGPEVTAVMTRICFEVKRCVPNIPVGVQVLAAQNRQALAVAVASGLQFVRCESFIFGHIADEGYIDGCAGPLLRYRKQLNAEEILIFSDIKKKHSSHAITSDVDLKEMTDSAKFFMSDGVVVTGTRTGLSPDFSQVEALKRANIDIPVLIGSGVNHKNINRFSRLKVDAVIVGSEFKENGVWSNQLSEKRIETFMNSLQKSEHIYW